MTVFSSVTATLSPELASCMKAKGKTWKEAFFDSLKTLVGVSYTVYKKESQWQIKGEWDAIKRAYHILAKVASIEKDAIAEYQAANTRVTRLRMGAQPVTPTLPSPRPRGRPPKRRPPPPTTEALHTEPLPPKRKRGRPRKVRVVPEYVKPGSDSDPQPELEAVGADPVSGGDDGHPHWPEQQPEAAGCDPTRQDLPQGEEEQKEAKRDTTNNKANVDEITEVEAPTCSDPNSSSNQVKDESEMPDNAKSGDTPDQYTNVMICVAKEAIMSSGLVSQTDATSESIPKSIDPPPTELSQQENCEDEDSVAILDYLGIKHKAPIEEPPEDHEKTTEQSKKLENLIEEMIEKMNTVHAEPKAVAYGPKYICTECPFTSNKKAFLRDHMRRQHIEVDLRIEPNVISAVKTGIGKRPGRHVYQCNECDYSTNSRKHLKEHRLRRHKEKTLTCEICNKKFAVSRDLSRHLKDHKTSAVRYPCKICGKKYKQFYVLKRHEKTHEEGYVKPVFPCSQCSKTFAAKQVLQIHINAVHLGNRPTYPCEKCGKNFTTKHSLAEHQLIHTNSKPYVCSICNKAFRHESTLKTHERLHTDTTQRYTCEYCGKAFRLRSSLRIHRNIHTGDKRFDCPVCGKKFTQKQSLLRHARIHTGEKPFTCELCGSSFYDYSILRRHVTGVHKMQWKSPTQHYVLPPGSYHEGRVIEQPDKKIEQPETEDQELQLQASQEESLPQQHQGPHHSHVHTTHVPPGSHSNQSLQPQPSQHGMHPLGMPPHASVPPSEHAAQLEKHLANSAHRSIDPQLLQRRQQSYHTMSQKVYQPAHIPLPNTLPSNLPVPQSQPMQSPSVPQAQPQPMQSPTPQPQPQPMHSPPPPMHSPPPPQHPMSPMTITQYQQPHTSPTMSLPSAYTLNPHLYYQNHH